jgi:hypothetical protein
MKRVEFKFAESALVRVFFRDILTGKDGVSFDAGRVMGLVGGVTFIAFGFAQVYEMIVTAGFQEFPFVSYGVGFGSVAAGVGSLIWLKKDTEPSEPSK